MEIVETISEGINVIARLLLEMRMPSLQSDHLPPIVRVLDRLAAALDALEEGVNSGKLTGNFVQIDTARTETGRLHDLLQKAVTQHDSLPVPQVEQVADRLLRALGVPDVTQLLAGV